MLKTVRPKVEDGKIWTKQLGPSLLRNLTLRECTTAWLYIVPLDFARSSDNVETANYYTKTNPFAFAPVGNPAADDLEYPNQWEWYAYLTAGLSPLPDPDDILSLVVSKNGDEYVITNIQTPGDITLVWTDLARVPLPNDNKYIGGTYRRYFWLKKTGETESFLFMVKVTFTASKQFFQKEKITGVFNYKKDYGRYDHYESPYTDAKIYYQQIIVDKNTCNMIGGWPFTDYDLVQFILNRDGIKYSGSFEVRYRGHFSGPQNISGGSYTLNEKELTVGLWAYAFDEDNKPVYYPPIVVTGNGPQYANTLPFGSLGMELEDGDVITIIPPNDYSGTTPISNLQLRYRQNAGMSGLVVGEIVCEGVYNGQLSQLKTNGNGGQGWMCFSDTIPAAWECTFNPVTNQWSASIDFAVQTTPITFTVYGYPWGFVKAGIGANMFNASKNDWVPVTIDIVFTVKRYLEETPSYFVDDVHDRITGDLWDIAGKGKIAMSGWNPVENNTVIKLFPLVDHSGSTHDRAVLQFNTLYCLEWDDPNMTLRYVMPGQYKIFITGFNTDGDWVRTPGQPNDFEHATAITVTKDSTTTVGSFTPSRSIKCYITTKHWMAQNLKNIAANAYYMDEGARVHLATGWTNESGWCVLSFDWHHGCVIELVRNGEVVATTNSFDSQQKTFVPELNEMAYAFRYTIGGE